MTAKQSISGSLRAERRKLRDSTPTPCPTCGQVRQTEETLRVHRALAHPKRDAGGGTAMVARVSGT